MPELPEIEVLKRSLNRNIKLTKINKIKINNPNLRYKVPINLNNSLKGQIIKNVTRISKYLIFNIKNKKKLLVHLGMSGTIHVIKNHNKKNSNASFYNQRDLPEKHNHIVIDLSKNLKLIYNDPRRFGYFKLLNNNFINEKPFNQLGPDPFKLDFNFLYIKKYIKNKKINVKSLLMDQSFVRGIGNIYANEILFKSHISPYRVSSKLTNSNINSILKNSKKILKKAILFGGSSIRDFKKSDGKLGNFQRNFKVYGKQNVSCPRNKCVGILKKVIINNRSAFFCAECQI